MVSQQTVSSYRLKFEVRFIDCCIAKRRRGYISIYMRIKVVYAVIGINRCSTTKTLLCTEGMCDPSQPPLTAPCSQSGAMGFFGLDEHFERCSSLLTQDSSFFGCCQPTLAAKVPGMDLLLLFPDSWLGDVERPQSIRRVRAWVVYIFYHFPGVELLLLFPDRWLYGVERPQSICCARVCVIYMQLVWSAPTP